MPVDTLHDGVDSSQVMVRSGRFRGSFLMATNGGSTFEEILRSQLTESRSRARHQGSQEKPLPDDRSPKKRLNLQNVIGADERQLIPDTTRIPVRSIGLLRILPEDGILRYGTAWLIGPQTLATAAHNLLHPQAGKTQRMDFALAYDGQNAHGGWHRVVAGKLSDGWNKSAEPGSPLDFAVLRLEHSLGNQTGWLGFADYEDAKFANMAVNLFGYPLDLEGYAMYGARGRVLAINEGRVFYDCDAGGGMSGGPVLAVFGEQRIAVGIHVAGGSTSNAATRISGPAYDLLERYRIWPNE